MLPFALLFVRGIEVACGPLPPRWRAPAGFGVLGVVLVVATLSNGNVE